MFRLDLVKKKKYLAIFEKLESTYLTYKVIIIRFKHIVFNFQSIIFMTKVTISKSESKLNLQKVKRKKII